VDGRVHPANLEFRLFVVIVASIVKLGSAKPTQVNNYKLGGLNGVRRCWSPSGYQVATSVQCIGDLWRVSSNKFRFRLILSIVRKNFVRLL
jgi:hypothetical protein